MAIAALGIAVPFWVFAASNFGIVAALLWWREPRKSAESLPAERLVSAVRAGIRHTANNQYLRATLMRVLAFFPFASAYLALLPLLARHLMDHGPQLYGVLLGAVGVGAVGGSLALRWLKDELGPDRLVAAGTIGAAFALTLFGLAREPITAICGCLVVGASWTVVMTKLYVSAQVALPDWARGRGLAVFLTFIFGATTVGSAAWGKLSALQGLPTAYFAAAAGAALWHSFDLGLETSDRPRRRFLPGAALARPRRRHGRSKTTGVQCSSWPNIASTPRTGPSSSGRSTNSDMPDAATARTRGVFMRT